jgi:putative IMPACT (imprinted ancient) family translation regulator
LDSLEETFRYSDDGEPGGSAGLPIFNQLRSAQLRHIAVVVVRYFGGKKLGVPGLINAYKVSTQLALDNASVLRKFLTDEFKITYTFEQTGPVMRALNEMELSILENGFETSPFVRVSIRKSLSFELKTKIVGFTFEKR